MGAGGGGETRTAVAFPGQGGDWAATVSVLGGQGAHPLVAALAERLGTDQWQDLDGLDTANAQPAVYVAGLVGPAAWSKIDGTAEFGVAVGHSLGEITAAAFAGAIEPLAGLDLVVARAQLGRAGQGYRPGAMAAVMRRNHADVDWLRRRVLASAPGVLEVGVTNSPMQQVLSGDADLVDRAVALANEEGAVARRLPIGGAYHSPLMAPAVDSFRRRAAAAVTAEPTMPLVCATAGRTVMTGDDLVEVLARSLVLPVDWPAAVAATVALGAGSIVDAGPGDTIARLGRHLRALPVIACP